MKKRLQTSSLIILSAAALHGAPVFQNDPGPLEGITTDIWDFTLGGRIVTSTQTHPFAGGPDPLLILGATSVNAWVEPTHFLFNDGAGAGTVDVIEWQAASAIDLTSFGLRLAQDGAGNAARGTSEFKLFGTRDGVAFSQLSGGLVPLDGGAMQFPALLISDNALTGTTTSLRGFRLEITRLSATGPRIVEMDGFGSAAAQVGTYLDRVSFNTNTISLAGRFGEGPGLTGSISASSLVLGSDTPEDAFGRNDGAVEPESFIFADGGVIDNGNLLLGDDGETVDFLQWHTDIPLNLAGFRIGLSGDGVSPNRDTELVRFLVEGVEVDIFDNNGFDGDVSRFFVGGAVTGDDFRLEFTRTAGTGGRVFEVDAITVPEPATATLLILGGMLCVRRRRK